MICSAASLKFYLSSESENYSALRSSADIRVVLNDGLQKEHWSYVQKRIEFNAVLDLKWRHAGLQELLTQAVAYVT